MSVCLRDHITFLDRTQHAYREQQVAALAAGERLDYGLDDLRPFVRHHLGERHCRYCVGPVTAANFALDLKNPPPRGGSFNFHNLAIVCAGCALAKGPMDYVEYKELLGLMRSWSPFIRRNLLARLRAAANVREGLEFLPNPRLLG